MQHSSDDELTPAEAAAFAALPRETGHPDQLAEERALHRLRNAGLLRQHGARRMTRMSAIGIGVAAAAITFIGGTFFGRQLAAREVRSASPSMQVQQAGTAYVAALVRLSGASDTERSPGLEAGTATLRAAATSLAQIDPSDSTAVRIRTSLGDDNHSTGDHSVIWF
jgi:hypothetical protein